MLMLDMKMLKMLPEKIISIYRCWAHDMFILKPGELSLNKIKTLLEQPISIHLDHDAFQRIEKARALVEQLAGGEQSVYGINTGFGKLAHKKIPNADLCLLQKNLILC
jgi:histidine ammonia-lyase